MILSHRETAVEGQRREIETKTTEYFLLKIWLKIHGFKEIENYETSQMIFYRNFKNLVNVSMRAFISERRRTLYCS